MSVYPRTLDYMGTRGCTQKKMGMEGQGLRSPLDRDIHGETRHPSKS